MSRRKISQAEARRMRREIEQLRERDRQRGNAWTLDYPGGVEVIRLAHQGAADLCRLARKLGHPIVATVQFVSGQPDQIILYAVKP